MTVDTQREIGERIVEIIGTHAAARRAVPVGAR
jgi:hypothetical protein